MPTDSEKVLNVFLGKELIAELTLLNDETYWNYNQAWADSGYMISPNLDFYVDIPAVNVQRFLRNLLPEGNGLEQLIRSFHLGKSNTFGLVRALGLDTPGALIFLPKGEKLPSKSSFRIITDEELEQRLDTREELDLIIWDQKPRLSVAGVQDKINVVFNEDGQLGFGDGDLCSTHILKFNSKRIPHLVINEFLSMRLAKACGLEVANVELKRYGKHSALLVERFDRKLIDSNKVERLHIIDGCQALNLPPEYKYERNFGSGRDVAHIRDGVSLKKLFKFTTQCSNPALAKQDIIDWVLFNLLIFNYDAHGKNISFFMQPGGISLAPFYDLVNIKLYPNFEHEMAMALGDEFEGENINAYQLADFADSCNFPRAWLANQLKAMIEKLTIAIQQNNMQFTVDQSERDYITKYLELIDKRCKHLLTQISEIITIEL